ncbi:hypothetical protein [Limnovirga soli]|uniref:Uncharacterized protein n=1 Tax=Limnovirga soli TaxID=2656915 RepID=A0A8J8JSW0_9BACT|nr:hypothetical protein [Limnovirga soli]NNV54500.1 hypothetical protein [Limnovirga soli]
MNKEILAIFELAAINATPYMTTTFRLLVIATFFFLYSCKSRTDFAKNYNNSNEVAFNLIKQCVDTMININPSFNTKNYVLDLSIIDTLNKQGVDSFLQIKNSNSPTTLDDSTMIFENGEPSRFHMQQSMIIKIRTITYKSDKVALVTASKIKSTDEIIDATIELVRYSDGYKINSLQITK